MNRSCKHYESCGLDYCQPDIAREGIECPHYEPKKQKVKKLTASESTTAGAILQTGGDAE